MTEDRHPAPASAPTGRNADLGVRLLSSAVLVPLALVCAWFGSWPTYGLAAAGAMIVFAEWAYVVDRSESLLPRRPAVVLGAVFVGLASLVAGSSGVIAAVAVAAAGVLGVAALGRSAWLVAGVVYAAMLGIPIAALRADPAHGFQALLVLLVLVWGTDSFAFFAGRSIGGPKLWPRVSPKKTWSGSIGGLVGGVAAALVAAALSGVAVTIGLAVLLVFLSLASQAGDLFESAVKRHFNKKDSSGIIPGHGGMMDRVDGLVFAGALALAVGWLHSGADQIAAGVLIW
ncbi:phosphatidate cytidylyltransferase [Kaistia soli DSM 19436]|uniref:Phosphatidate cytidylyltransferase n=1 Tax=Kaistia soli DSM 19436 TaxID=1122133 RepID=A0A1M5H5Z7_9HYPH|nr:phosphatidate cytidylyltransferase [Kaistia soli]SHG11162.1 phosphatidate cytidylyltransferase [Kaistia soli DSM 19436]